MKHLVQKLLRTYPNIGFSIARLTLGLVIFPHGAQKLLGLFGGYDYAATMESFTRLTLGLVIFPHGAQKLLDSLAGMVMQQLWNHLQVIWACQVLCPF